MSISDIFNAASTGINMQRLALEVTGENVANVNTEGYSRQRVILETAPVREFGNYSLGGGVKLAAIQRYHDALLQRQISDAGSGYNQSLSRQTALKQIEPLFNEITTDGLGKSIQDFFDSWHDLSLSPQGGAERQAVIARAQIMVDTFHQTNASLESVRASANKTLADITGSISETTKSIASLNDQIRLSELSGGNANELRDKRDLAVRDLAGKVGISYFEESDGNLSISLSNGQQLVSGGSYGSLYTYPNPSGMNDIFITTLGNPPLNPDHNVDRNITSLVDGTNGVQGEIGGTLLVRDVIVPDMLGKIDELASKISGQVNSAHWTGWGLDSTTNNSFFSTNSSGSITLGSNQITMVSTAGLQQGMTVAGPGIPDGSTIAAVIDATHVQITSNATTPATALGANVPLIVDSKGFSMSIKLSADLYDPVTKVLDPRRIAAADKDPVFGGPGNNNNALSIAQLSNTDSVFSSGTTSIVSFYTSLVSKVGIDVKGTDDQATREEAFIRQLNALRESNAGVSLDEELTNLIKYQKAFEGSAKMINTATEMMDVVLGLVR